MESATMENPPSHLDTITSLRVGVTNGLAMLAGMQLDIFTPLRHGPMTTEQIADAIGVAPTRLPLLLYALVAAGLLTEQNGHFANTPDAQHFLVKDSDSYMGYIHGQVATLWRTIFNTAETLRTGIPQDYLDFSGAPQEELEIWMRRMNPRAAGVTQDLIEHYDLSSAQTLVDVGGGGCGSAIALTKAYPQLHVTVADLSSVTPIGQKIVEEEGEADRIAMLAADVVKSPLPGAYDAAILQRLIQVLSAEDARQVIQHVSTAINPGGTIYIIGQILDDSRISPPAVVGANLQFLNLYYEGECYTEGEHRSWLSEAGFVDINRADFLIGGGLGVMTAHKPE